MKARDIVGKTIAHVEQHQWEGDAGRDWVLHRITFTDGSAMMFTVLERETQCGVAAIYPARQHDDD